MLRRTLIYICFLFLTCCVCGNASASTPATPLDDLQKRVLALDSAWTRAINDLEQKKGEGVLQDEDKKDYAKFISYLSIKIDAYCRQLRNQGGDQAISDLPCPDAKAFEPVNEESLTPSTNEVVAELDDSLAKALSEFDQQLLKEDQRIASRTPKARETGSGFPNGSRTGSTYNQGGGTNGSGPGGQSGSESGHTGKSGGSGSQTGNQGSGSPYSGGSQSGNEGQMSSAGGAGAGTGQPGSAEQQPGQQEIESGYDDIVARQLREAAEKETDPELKKKLWDEYRKYKEGIH